MRSLTNLVHASDPLRFDLGGKRGGGGPAGGEEAEAEAHLLQVALEHMQAQTKAVEELFNHLRMQRQRVYTEVMYAASAARAEPQQGTQEQFRVTYIWAFVGGSTKTATLHLRGGLSNDLLSFPVPVSTQPPLAVVLGDGDTGGLILDRRDQRYITVDDGSSQLLIAILAGEVLKDTYLS